MTDSLTAVRSAAPSLEDSSIPIEVIDVDTHLLEPPDLWTSRLPRKWAEMAPQVVADPDSGVLRWSMCGFLMNTVAFYAHAGWPEFFPSHPPTIDDADPGAYDPVARLRWMDTHGIHAQVLYPNILGFHSFPLLDTEPEFAIAVVRAYNDHQTDFAATAPNRLLPVTCLPFWDVEASLAELERCASLGHRIVNFGYRFEKYGLPRLRDDHWAPILKFAEEAEIPLAFHIGFNSRIESDFRPTLPKEATMENVAITGLLFMGNAECIVELITSELCAKYPHLNFISVESGFGFIPFLLQGLDWQFLNLGVHDHRPDLLLPSEYFQRQIYGTFWFETGFGGELEKYSDNLMFETDYPHPTSLSPGAGSYAQSPAETIKVHLGHLSDEVRAKLLHDNAARLLHL